MNDETTLQTMVDDGSPIVDEAPPWLAEYEDFTEEELKNLIKENFALSITTTLRVARGICAMELRGMDTRDLLPQSMYHTLRRIAYGQMLPEVFFVFAGQQRLISRVSSLPIPEQRRLVADGATIDLVVYNHRGEQDIIPMAPAKMKPEQFHQAFAHDHIRSHSEQVAHLLEANRVAKQSHMERIGDLELDIDGKCAYVGRKRIPLEHLVQAVKCLKG